MENPGPSSSVENISQKVFTITNKISEIINDLDSDDASFSEHSWQWHVQSKFTLQQHQQQ
jgi:hypothetical protein